MTLLRLRLRVLGYSIRKKVPHGSIKQIMGFHSSNWQANHRVMQIARDEISNELRVMQQLLPSVMCGHLGPNYDRQAAFRFLQESASTLLSDSWNHFLRHPRNGGDVSTKAQPEPPINLSGVTLSPATESLLAHGLKFAPPVNSSRVDELASVYEIAAKIPEDSRQDFVGAGTRAVCFHGGSRRAKNASTPVIKELQAGELSLLQADKTGQFVILNKQQMQEKSDEALKKNFIGLKTRPSGSLSVDDRLHVKLADSALSRDLYPDDYHCLGDGENRPVKWLALESLVRGQFSAASDVWMYGVALWELMTLAQQPYAELDPFEVAAHLSQGYRLGQPVNCPDPLFGVMELCWRAQPDSRPGWLTLLRLLADLYAALNRFI
ncbi:uncharacterized protein ISCGN_017009 [Ixodes scapularis]